jgi:hypothetical protein
MMQPAEYGRRLDAVADGQLVPVAAGRNAVLGWFRQLRFRGRVEAAEGRLLSENRR